MHGRRILLVVAVAVAIAGSARSASAAQLWTVCPGGSCSFLTVNSAVSDPSVQSGDGIDVLAGTYDEEVTVHKQLDIFGDASGPRPVITDNSTAVGHATFIVGSGGAGTTLRHLELRATGGTNPSTVLTPRTVGRSTRATSRWWRRSRAGTSAARPWGRTSPSRRTRRPGASSA